MENNKNKKSMKFQGDMLNFCDFIQVFVFTRNHHLKFTDRPNMISCLPRGREATTQQPHRQRISNLFYDIQMQQLQDRASFVRLSSNYIVTTSMYMYSAQFVSYLCE